MDEQRHSAPAICRSANPLSEIRVIKDFARAAFARKPKREATIEGTPVLVVPGFGTGDAAMSLLHRDLQARGFIALPWEQGINLGPRGQTMRRLAQRLRALSRRYRRRVHVVGWSLGGVLARLAASRAPEAAGHVITLGSPLSGDPSCSWLARVVQQASGLAPNDRRVRAMLNESAVTPVTSIYSRNDGVVHWSASVEAPGDVRSIEVEATHVGMVADPQVFATVAAELTRANASLRA